MMDLLTLLLYNIGTLVVVNKLIVGFIIGN